jgi:hypothetical protein
MNSNHVINGWLAQLSVNARREAGRSRAGVEPASPVLDLSIAVQPASPALEVPMAAEPIAPTRTRGRLLPGRVWGRDGAPRRAVGGPCLSLG